MVRVTVVARSNENLYGQIVKRNLELGRKGKGTLYRSGKKQKDFEKWAHLKHPGWIWFQKGMGGMVVALINSKSADGEWQLLMSFVGFIDRHFRNDVANVVIAYVMK